jgi:hypothetical protein
VLHRVLQRKLFLETQVVIETTDAAQMAIDRLRLPSPGHQIIDVGMDLSGRDLLDMHVQPQHIMALHVQIIFNCVAGVAPALQIAAVVGDHVGQVHRTPPVRYWP